MSDKQILLYFGKNLNKIAQKILLDIPYKKLQFIKEKYFFIISNVIKEFSTTKFVFEKENVLESIKEFVSKSIDTQINNLYEINIFYNFKFFNSEISSLKCKEKYYSIYLCNFVKIILSYYFDKNIEKNIKEYNKCFNDYKTGKITKKSKLYSKLINELDDYNLNNFKIDILSPKIKFEIYFYLSVFELYLNGLVGIIDVKDELINIFKGTRKSKSLLDIINELIKDDKIFQIPKYWLNSYNSLEKQQKNNIISFLFFYFDFKENDLKCFFDDFSDKDLKKIKEMKGYIKHLENEQLLKELEIPKEDKKTKKKENNLNKEKNEIEIKEENGNTNEETNNIEEINNNDNIEDTHNIDIRIEENNNNLINEENTLFAEKEEINNLNNNNLLPGLFDEILKLNKTITIFKGKIENVENDNKKLKEENVETKKEIKLLKSKVLEQNIKIKDQNIKIKDQSIKIKEEVAKNKIQDVNIKYLNNQINLLKESNKKLKNNDKVHDKKINKLEKLLLSSNLNINFLGNCDYFKTTLALILYTEGLNIYNNKEKNEIKSFFIITKELVDYYQNINKENNNENKNKIKIVEFLLFLIRCREQDMHKVTKSSLKLKSNTNALKLYNDNNFYNMLDSLIIFIQPSELNALFRKRQNELKSGFIKDDYRQLIINVLESKNEGYEFKYIFKKPFNIKNKNYEPVFSISPNILYDYFEKMKFEIKYKECYEKTDWKSNQNGIFELDWK